MNEPLTEKQEEVMDEVQRLLSEHFDAHVFVVDVANVSGTMDHVTASNFKGGYPMTMGLCQWQLNRMRKWMEE